MADNELNKVDGIETGPANDVQPEKSAALPLEPTVMEKPAEDKKEPEGKAASMDKSSKEPKPEKAPKPPKAEKAVKPPKSAADKKETPPPEPEQPHEPREAPRKDEQEQIVYINLSELHAFKNHPFQVRNDEEMAAMVESVKDNPERENE